MYLHARDRSKIGSLSGVICDVYPRIYLQAYSD